LSKNSTEKELAQTIIKVIKEEKPQTVKQLASFVRERVSVGEREIVDLILKLQGEGKITLEKPLWRQQRRSWFLLFQKTAFHWHT